MINHFVETMLTHNQETLCTLLANGIAAAQGTIYGVMTAHERTQLATLIAENILAHFAATQPIEVFAQRIISRRVHDPDYTPESIAVIMQIIATALFTITNATVRNDHPDREAILAAIHDLVLRDSTACFVVYATERERALQTSLTEQTRLLSLLRERSMPIMPVAEGIIVVPVIGQMDAVRAQELTEDLLQAIVWWQAEQVILDLTGVPWIDPTSANQIIQMTKAVALLGAQPMLVGIDGTIAQTLTALGVPLANIRSRANLQAGIVDALAFQGYAIQPRSTVKP